MLKRSASSSNAGAPIDVIVSVHEYLDAVGPQVFDIRRGRAP